MKRAPKACPKCRGAVTVVDASTDEKLLGALQQARLGGIALPDDAQLELLLNEALRRVRKRHARKRGRAIRGWLQEKKQAWIAATAADRAAGFGQARKRKPAPRFGDANKGPE